MPLVKGKDKEGHFYRWGRHGKRYYYEVGNKLSEMEASWRALRQGKVIEMRMNMIRNF